MDRGTESSDTSYLKKSACSYLLYLLTFYVLAYRVEYTEDTFASASSDSAHQAGCILAIGDSQLCFVRCDAVEDEGYLVPFWMEKPLYHLEAHRILQ